MVREQLMVVRSAEALFAVAELRQAALDAGDGDMVDGAEFALEILAQAISEMRRAA